MNNKKGFSLIELLIVIVVLTIISIIAIASYKNINGKIAKKNYDSLITYIETAAVQFANDNSVDGVITLQDLIDLGYISADDGENIYNPIDKTKLTCNKIIISYDDNNDDYVSSFTTDIQDYDENNKCNADFVQVYAIDSYTSTLEAGVQGNIVLVLDISGSMGDALNEDANATGDENTRLYATKQVINSLAETLLSKNGGLNPTDYTKIALITFANGAEITQPLTTDLAAFKSKVNGLTAFGGTNWEAALDAVQELNINSSVPTYVIFVSDGAPTFHVTDGRYGDFNSSHNVFGTGQEEEPNMQYSYEQAVDEAQEVAALVDNNFYTIFAYGTEVGVNYLSSLTQAAIGSTSNFYNATNTTELYNALNVILKEEIKKEGSGSTYLSQNGTILFGAIEISASKPLFVFNGTNQIKKYTKEDNTYLIKENDEYYFDVKKFAKAKHLSIKDITLKYYN